MNNISNKSVFIEYQQRYAFGNRLQEWDSIEAYKKSGYKGKVVARYRQPGSPFMRYDIPYNQFDEYIRQCETNGAKRELFWVNDSELDEKDLLLQGEYFDGPDGPQLYCSRDLSKMRIALVKSGYHLYGLNARRAINEVFNASSLADFRALIEKFPDHVIEFGAYNKNVGMIPGRNVIIWEVRNY